jgi:hypothetical protein
MSFAVGAAMHRFSCLSFAFSLSLLLVTGCTASSSTETSSPEATSDELRDDSMVSGDTSWETTFRLPALGSAPADEQRLHVVLHPSAGAPSSSMRAYLETIDGGEGGFPTRYNCRTDIAFPTGTADVTISNAASGGSVYQATRNLSAALSFESPTTGPDVECHPHQYPSFTQNAALTIDVDGSIPLPNGGHLSFVNGVGFGGALDAQNEGGRYRLTAVRTRIPSSQYEVWVQLHDAQGAAVGSPTLALFRRL